MKELRHTQQALHAIKQKYASWLKTPLDSLPVVQSFGDSPLYRFTDSSEIVYPVQGDQLNLKDVLSWEKFVKSPMKEGWDFGAGFLHAVERPHLVMSMYLVGMIWMVYEAVGYEGPGGLFVSPAKGEPGFAIEGIAGFLASRYPRRED